MKCMYHKFTQFGPIYLKEFENFVVYKYNHTVTEGAFALHIASGSIYIF